MLLLLPGACTPSTDSTDTHRLTDHGTEAADPYFTEDHLGNPVLCWTEKRASDGSYLLKYAAFDPSAGNFGPAVEVAPSLGTRTSAESANKVAFKRNGTVVAVFGKRIDNSRNRFASVIQYAFSADGGRSWSEARYLHSDTSQDVGRGFFDLATLADGEVAAVWLDGRHGRTSPGSSLFFALTLPGAGFGPDKRIGEGTCECCRTDILVDSAGRIHLAYRDILSTEGIAGKPVRDMVYTYSDDNGASFRPPLRISADNWEVDGCPHSGPSLAVETSEVHAVWFTAGRGPDEPGLQARGPGVYRAVASREGEGFGSRIFLSSEARHPQLVRLPAGGTALVWDETSADSSSIVLTPLNGSGPDKGGRIQVTVSEAAVHHPVAYALAPEKVLVAWVQEAGGKPGIAYRVVSW